MIQPIIDVVNLNKVFGLRHAVNNLNLQINKGKIFGFIGPNGGGKTTLMRLLCGLLIPTSGQGQCLGYDIVTQSYEIKKHTGYMTQKFSFYEDLSVLENLLFIARLYNIKNRMQAIEACIQAFDLTPYQHIMTGNLSGGWKQRMALAACLVHKPDLLLLDEPTAGVDPKARLDFWLTLQQLKATGITILVSTHYMDEAKQCDELAYVSGGKILIQGSPDSIIRSEGMSLEDIFIRLSTTTC